MGKLLERLRDASRSGVYRVTHGAEVLEAARQGSLRLETIRYADKAAVLKNIGAALGFPDWFGHNWDALEDCLTDLSWSDAKGHVLLFEGGRRDDDLGVLIDVLRSSAEYWAARGKPFFALFVDPEASLRLPALFGEP